MEDVNEIIRKCIESGDWSVYDKMITREDLMNYLIKINDESTRAQQIKCPLCIQTIKANRFTITHRAVKFLMTAGKMSKKGDNEYNYFNYEEVRLKCKELFDVNFTSYGLLTKSPWDFIIANVDSNDKTKRDGMFKLTSKGYNFLRGKISVPETLWILKNQVIKQSSKQVNVATAKKINFNDCVETLNSF